MQKLMILSGGKITDSGEIDATGMDVYKFAGLLKSAIYSKCHEWLGTKEDIDNESDPLIKEYLRGYDGGIVDALCEIKNFGLDID